MSSINNESVGQVLVIELLEAAINQALSFNPEALEKLKNHTGRVVRFKTLDPDFSCYITICDDGVQLFSEHEGPIDGRVRISAWLFTRYILGVYPTLNTTDIVENIKFSGDTALLVDLMNIATEYSVTILLRKILKQWLPDFESFDDILKALREHEPAWMSRIEHLPQLVNETLVMLRAQSDIQQEQYEDIRRIREMLESDRKVNQMSTIVGFVLIIVAFITQNNPEAFPIHYGLSLDTTIMLIVAMVLLVPRLRSGVQFREKSASDKKG